MSEKLLQEILTEIRHVKTELNHVKTEITGINKRLDNVETEQQQINQAVYETNEHFKQLANIQKGQQEIIELLSVRSIEHEAALKHAN